MDICVVDEAVFVRVKDTIRNDDTFTNRMLHQLAKCKLNPSVAHHPQPQYFGGGRGRGRNSHSHSHRDRDRDHHRDREMKKPVIIGSSSIMGMLNKVSPKNIDTLSAKIMDLALSSCVATSAATIVKHSIKQSVYMSMFVRLLGEISAARCGARAHVVSAIDFVVQAHIKGPILEAIPPDVPQTDYDGFCARIKGIKTLLATVAFGVGCIRAHLCDSIDLDGYARVIVDNLSDIGDTVALETMLQVVEVFQSSSDGCDIYEFREKIAAWAKTLEGKGILTPRARFKLIDIL